MSDHRAEIAGPLCRSSGFSCRFRAGPLRRLAPGKFAVIGGGMSSHVRRNMRSIAKALLWPLALGAIVLGVNTNAPYLVALRGSGNGVLLAFGIVMPIVLMRAGAWADGKAGRLL